MSYRSKPIAISSMQPPPPITRGDVLRALAWIAIAVPAIYQIGLLITAIAGRVSYPYDLEWMEGGMLHHALRIHNGEGIYVPPSVDFIPYLYTPLYPSVLALLGSAFGITYALGRAISVLALIGIALAAAIQLGHRKHDHMARGPVWAGIALALGLFAAAYPAVDGWYDLVRADTLFLFMVTAALAGLPWWARSGEGIRGHGKVAAGAALLALAVLCKQTGIIYLALGGAIVLVLAWRRLPIYIATAGAIGLGGTWLLNRTTGGWFWTYASEIHRAHDFNLDRFWKSFTNILWRPELHGVRYPALGAAITGVVIVALVVVAVTWWRRRMVPRQAHPLLLWTMIYMVSTVVGAVGWGTEFAHFNAYMPAFLHGALAAGAAVPAIYACMRLNLGADRRSEPIGFGASLAAGAVLAFACWNARWSPRKFVPTEADAAAGARLVERIRQLSGEVWMPSHPWYLYLAGKTPHVHRMGIKDVTHRQPRTVEGLDAAIRSHAFAAIVLDEPDVHNREVTQLGRWYRPTFKLPRDERPRLYSGARIAPDSIWMPVVPATPPRGARVVFDFESATWDGWMKSGGAWGNGPVTTPLPGQEMVLGATGARFATSMHGGDAATGRMTSPPFVLDGARLTMRLGGGTDATKLRVELWVENTEINPLGATDIVATASVLLPGGEALREVTLDVSQFRGKSAKLVLVDDAETGHLVIDDVWVWQ
ncbi:MAG: hypothetical protein ACTHU0_10185 [Kofleriaceae bacterium]